MKQIFTLSIFAIVMLTAVSCRTNDNGTNGYNGNGNGYENGNGNGNGNGETTVYVTGVSINETSVALLIDSVFALTATVLPDSATNKNVVWTSNNNAVATVNSDGIVTAISPGIAVITVTTEDGGFTATSKIDAYTALDNFCNTRTPGWGDSLGTVSFHTDQEWTIEGNGITQIWSDAVTATNCQKTDFNGAAGVFSFNADCRSNPDFPGDFFSWCAVVRFANVLCPYPWRVPTREDFRNLDIALGGNGEQRFASSSNIATPEFVIENYLNRWGGFFGGNSALIEELSNQGFRGLYWSLTEFDISFSHHLLFYAIGTVFPQDAWDKSRGLKLRCIR